MVTIVIMFLVGYIFHLLYKGIDGLIILVRTKRNELKGESDK